MPMTTCFEATDDGRVRLVNAKPRSNAAATASALVSGGGEAKQTGKRKTAAAAAGVSDEKANVKKPRKPTRRTGCKKDKTRNEKTKDDDEGDAEADTESNAAPTKKIGAERLLSDTAALRHGVAIAQRTILVDQPPLEEQSHDPPIANTYQMPNEQQYALMWQLFKEWGDGKWTDVLTPIPVAANEAEATLLSHASDKRGDTGYAYGVRSFIDQRTESIRAIASHATTSKFDRNSSKNLVFGGVRIVDAATTEAVSQWLVAVPMGRVWCSTESSSAMVGR